MLRPFFSDWMMFKIVECDWLMNLRGTGYPFDKIIDYKRIKQNKASKCLFSYNTIKKLMSTLMTTFFRRLTLTWFSYLVGLLLVS